MSKVLIVDDEQDIRTLVRSLFEQRGWTADEASSGAEAVAFTNENDYDALVLDQSMPGMSGFEVLQQLRSDGNMRPVIFYSAYLNPDLERELALDPGELHVIEKTDFTRLVNVIGTLTGAA